MQDKSCQIAVQYIREVYAKAHVRPYENKHSLATELAVKLSREALPTPGHHRVEVEIAANGVNAAGVLCFESKASVEAIVVEQNLNEAELTQMLDQHIPGTLVGTLRVAISTASLQTGYGPITLPPISGDQLQALARKPKLE